MNVKCQAFIEAESSSDLLLRLRAIHIKVPSRSCGRTKKHCERWSICRWLATMVKNGKFEWPLSVCHRDKPDFWIQTGGREIGAECTEGIHKDHAHVSAIKEKIGSVVLLGMSNFKWGEKKTNKEKYQIAKQEKVTGPGWIGNSAEREWVQTMKEIIENKTVNLRDIDFDKFETNILLIYDNLHLQPDNKVAANFLSDNLSYYWGSELVFNYVFIETGTLLLHFSIGGFKETQINDLWIG